MNNPSSPESPAKEQPGEQKLGHEGTVSAWLIELVEESTAVHTYFAAGGGTPNPWSACWFVREADAVTVAHSYLHKNQKYRIVSHGFELPLTEDLNRVMIETELEAMTSPSQPVEAIRDPSTPTGAPMTAAKLIKEAERLEDKALECDHFNLFMQAEEYLRRANNLRKAAAKESAHD